MSSETEGNSQSTAPTKTAARLQVAVRGAVIVLQLGDEKLEVSTDDAPDLIRQLLQRRRRFSAKAVYEAWWVALAAEHGFPDFSLGAD